MTVFLFGLLVLAGVVIAVLLVRGAVYRARHPHTAEDLADARRDSLTRSRHVTIGKAQEHLAPLFPEFLEQFNPSDARFLGSPLDFVVFDGLCEDEDAEVRQVVFVEVKTGEASLTKRERRVRDAILAGRVTYKSLRLPGSVDIEVGRDDDPPSLSPADDAPAEVRARP
jgi:predicted Holliday junction resolvase-like endonuclease